MSLAHLPHKVMDLMQEKMNDTGETERGGVRYWHTMGKGMNIWFGALSYLRS